MWRGWHGRALTWRHTRAEPVSLNCSLLWSRCLAARETVSVAQHTLEGSSFPGWGCRAGAVSSSLMCSRGTLGIFTTSIKRSWAFSFLRPTAARPLHLTSCLERCTAYPSAVQRVALDSWAVTSLNRFSSLAEAFSRRLRRPSASMMPQSQTSSPPQDPVNDRQSTMHFDWIPLCC